jgi:hypothetical protein
MNEEDEPEPIVISIILAPWRLVKGVLSGIKRSVLSHFPAFSYLREKQKRDALEVSKELEDVAGATRELERRLKNYEKEEE